MNVCRECAEELVEARLWWSMPWVDPYCDRDSTKLSGFPQPCDHCGQSRPLSTIDAFIPLIAAIYDARKAANAPVLAVSSED